LPRKKLPFRHFRKPRFRFKSTAALLLLWLTASSVAAFAKQRGGHERAKLPAARIDINRATAKDFAKLPGVGPELARRIVAYRSKHGPFRRVQDLLAIRGIGPKKWRALKPHLRIGKKGGGQ
jgi:competence ComEA-like helix-hairpin-helix protein